MEEKYYVLVIISTLTRKTKKLDYSQANYCHPILKCRLMKV